NFRAAVKALYPNTPELNEIPQFEETTPIEATHHIASYSCNLGPLRGTLLASFTARVSQGGQKSTEKQFITAMISRRFPHGSVIADQLYGVSSTGQAHSLAEE